MRYNCSYPHIQTDGVLETPTARSNQRKGKFRMATSDSTSNIPYGYCHCGCGQKTRIAERTDRTNGWVKGEPKRFINGHYKPKSVIPVLDRFWPKVNKNGSVPEHCPELGACWEWTATKLPGGYGNFSSAITSHKEVRAHRFSYELAYGPIPKGLNVLHRCDNPACVNPDHLFLGTHKDNADDMVSKGRNAKGEMLPQHKLTESDVLYIRRRYAQGGISQRKLAKEMNVSFSAVHLIIERINWKHLKEEDNDNF